mmetsp:Transcript_18388/g.52700  ORF Transcript_18388/g.52700 Transcript_18388/m.52700 type:complete len:311 (-) Transcript_18388:398-1330(-)
MLVWRKRLIWTMPPNDTRPTTLAATLGTKEKASPTPDATAARCSTEGALLNRSYKIFISFDLPSTKTFVIVIDFMQFVRLIRFTCVGRCSFHLTYIAITAHARGKRHTQWLAAYISLPPNGIVRFRYVVPPMLQTDVHIVPCNLSPLKVGLQRQRRRHGRLFRIADTLILVRTTEHIARPFVAPPSIASPLPERSVALTSLTGHHPPKQRPAARHQFNRSTSHRSESKRTPIKGMGHNGIGIPRPAAAHAKQTGVGFVNLDAIGIDAEKGPFEVFLADVAAHLVTRGAAFAHDVHTAGHDEGPEWRTHPK